MPIIVSGFAALAEDPLALTGIVMLVFALMYAGYAALAKAGR